VKVGVGDGGWVGVKGTEVGRAKEGMGDSVTSGWEVGKGLGVLVAGTADSGTFPLVTAATGWPWQAERARKKMRNEKLEMRNEKPCLLISNFSFLIFKLGKS
jgi:hypothetical protein